MRIVFEIPDEQKDRLISTICKRYSYQNKILVEGVLVGNPEGRAAFTKRLLVQVIKDIVCAQEQNDAMEAARAVPPPDITEGV